jgi:hypothetical protein
MADRDPFDDLRAAYGAFEPPEPRDAPGSTDEAIASWMRAAYETLESERAPFAVEGPRRSRRFGPWLAVAGAVAAGVLLWVRFGSSTPAPEPTAPTTVAVATDTNASRIQPDVEEDSVVPPTLLATRPRKDGLEVVSGPVRLLLIAPVSGAEGASFPEEDR